jgi:hypothetical protein
LGELFPLYKSSGDLSARTIDGGGIRGLSELLILREIMWRIQIDMNLDDMPLPCEYFDLIGGTSTGGFANNFKLFRSDTHESLLHRLIALMLGRLRLSVDDAIGHYSQFAKHVFSKKKWKGQNRTFKATKLEEAFKRIVTSSGKRRADELMMDPLPQHEICKT